jgi:hypothetical protein
LDGEEFALFLGLLGGALASGPLLADGVRTTTSDGTLEIFLQRAQDHALAEIQTPAGVFRGEDYLITIADLRISGEMSRSAVAAD